MESFPTENNPEIDPSKSHVYFLMVNEACVYVGKSINLRARLNSHKAKIEFTGFRAIEIETHRLEEVETYFIEQIRPELNVRNNPDKYREYDFERHCEKDAQKVACRKYEQGLRESNRLKTAIFRLSHEYIHKLDNKALEAGLNRTELFKRWINE